MWKDDAQTELLRAFNMSQVEIIEVEPSGGYYVRFASGQTEHLIDLTTEAARQTVMSWHKEKGN